MYQETRFCRLHPDFHIPGSAVVGEGFDGPSYVRKLKEHGTEVVAFFLKCHYGHAYYDTAFPNRHPGLRKDMVREVAEACRDQDVRFVAYYSVFLDSVAWEQHPDWRIQATREGVDAGFESKNFQGLCVSSGYLDELLIPQCQEALRAYPVDEILFDTMTGFHPCYCEACRSQFGKPIPTDEKDPDWLEYVRWYRGQYDAFFAKTAKVLRDEFPELEVIFNWNWSIRQPVPPPEGINRLTADLFATGRVGSPVCRYFASTGLPYSYMTGRFLYALGDWSSARPATLKYTAATSIANGGSFYLIDRQLPDGSLEDRAYETMQDVFDFMNERRRVLGAHLVPETAVLFSYDTVFGTRLERFPDMQERRRRMDRHEGIARLMIERGRHYVAFNEQTLSGALESARLVILPETETISDELAAALTRFVETGGSLLLTHPSGGQPDPRLLELAGIATDGFAEKDYGYFEVPGKDAISVTSRFARSTIRQGSGAERLVRYVAPVGTAGSSGSFGHGYAPPGEVTDSVVASVRSVGQGQIGYVGFPLFESFQRVPNFYAGDLLIDLLDRLLPNPIARLDTEAQVELVTARKGDDLVVNLVNHAGKEEMLNGWYPRTEFVPELRGLTLEVKEPARESLSPVSVPGGESLPLTTTKDGTWHIALPEMKYMTSVLVEGYFG